MNSELETLLEQLRPQSTRGLLDELARVGMTLARHDRSRPEIEVHLASGQTLRGRLISVSDHGAIIHAGGTARAPTVSFVRVDQIAAVTVGDASVLAKPVLSDAPVPSRLELGRQCAARGDGLSGTLGRAIAIELGGASELDDEGRRAIGLALPVVQEVLAAIASEAMGREALAKLDLIELGASTEGEVRVDGRRLVIRAAKLLSEQPTPATLRKAIERLL